MQSAAEKVDDRTLPTEVRKSIYLEVVDAFMNPEATFNPNTFDPKKGTEGYDVRKRHRVDPPMRLPTMGLKPKQLLQGQMVGMYESKQDLYLIMAHYINQLLDRIEALEKRP